MDVPHIGLIISCVSTDCPAAKSDRLIREQGLLDDFILSHSSRYEFNDLPVFTQLCRALLDHRLLNGRFDRLANEEHRQSFFFGPFLSHLQIECVAMFAFVYP